MKDYALVVVAILAFGLSSMTMGAELNLFPGENWKTGYIDLGDNSNYLFYYHFRCRNASILNPPLLVFLDGGPGYSSAFGAYEHGGPYIVNNKTGKIEYNKYAWSNFTDILFIDQPAGTLFSYSKNASRMCNSQKEVVRDLYAFMVKFYSLNPEYKTRDLYIGGVSYGGHYAPAFAGHLLRKANPDFKLKGISIHNGLVDLDTQLQTLPRFLYENKLAGIGLYYLFQGMVLLCRVANTLQLEAFVEPCAMSIFIMFEIVGTSKDPYDIQNEYGPDPYDVALNVYLNKPDVQNALGVNLTWVSTNRTVFEKMLGDFRLSLYSDISLALEKGVKVNMMYGDKDYVCNYMGAEDLAKRFEWKGKESFLKEEYKKWMVDGTELGKYKAYDNLALVVVYNAGHSVEAKQRYFASKILQKWMGYI